MKDKEFEATVVVICLIIISFIVGLGIAISEKESKENNVCSLRYEKS